MKNNQFEVTSLFDERFQEHSLEYDNNEDTFESIDASFSYKQLQRLHSNVSQPPILNALELENEPEETPPTESEFAIVRFYTSFE